MDDSPGSPLTGEVGRTRNPMGAPPGPPQVKRLRTSFDKDPIYNLVISDDHTINLHPPAQYGVACKDAF